MKREGLSDARVASITTKEYVFPVHFTERYIKSWKSATDEWLNAICCSSLLFGIFITKWCVEFSVIFFGKGKIEKYLIFLL